jgi:HTH-type transcriptional regulator/antitoxin HigA
MPIMIATSDITTAAQTLILKLPLLSGITSKSDYAHALALIDELIESYDNNIVLIEALSNVIDRYESECMEFAYLNRRQIDIDPAISTLQTIMDQHSLSMSDFEAEIGKKSMVSQVLAGKRNLSYDHIAKLAKRFAINPALFF